MIVDSTVLVDLVRGKKEAEVFLQSIREPKLISRAGVIELVRGARTKKEAVKIKKILRDLEIKVVEISESISELAGLMFETYWHSHGLGAMDALVAATTIIENEILASHNTKHFKFIRELKLLKPY